MNIFPEVQKDPDGWLLEAKVVNVHDWHTSFHDVQILAFTANGRKVCQVLVGDLSGHKRIVETTCVQFPSIIMATAKETPCENAHIPVVRWAGTEDQQTRTFTSGERLWKSTLRKCNEKVPPERILDKFETVTEDQ